MRRAFSLVVFLLLVLSFGPPRVLRAVGSGEVELTHAKYGAELGANPRAHDVRITTPGVPQWPLGPGTAVWPFRTPIGFTLASALREPPSRIVDGRSVIRRFRLRPSTPPPSPDAALS